MKKYYVGIDTNVLVSAMLKWNSVPGSIVEMTFDGPIIPILKHDINVDGLRLNWRRNYKWPAWTLGVIQLAGLKAARAL